MDVPAGVWIVGGIIIIILSWITFWVTNKAYSKKWENDEQDFIK
ncbi:hypothetical protein [Paenibacillus selenitireducens]|jgi:hypothetical protein|nr:hypothetical protein [Paenibacillus selenitireducens]